MFFRRKTKDKIGLLPYIREDINSISTDSIQTRGWEITKLGVPDIWRQSTGMNVTIAVIDTGCDIDHEDLKHNILDGKNFIQPNTSPLDKVGHGTHVASTIAASNNTRGIVGVAPDSKIIPVKALGDDGMGDIRKIIDAVLWCADSNADIITMSLGSSYDSKDLHKAIQYAVSKNKVIFCAAGNSGEDSGIMYPAFYDEVIAIGAVDENLERTNFTCSGPQLDFLAPGDKILGCVPGNKYALMSGTSMSNPFAVGCAALWLSFNKRKGKSNIHTDEYISFFGQRTIRLTNEKYFSKKYQGYGIIRPTLS